MSPTSVTISLTFTNIVRSLVDSPLIRIIYTPDTTFSNWNEPSDAVVVVYWLSKVTVNPAATLPLSPLIDIN